MTTIKRVVYPEGMIEAAKASAKNYYVFHRNEVDFLDRGFKAIPSLFKFAFLKEMVEKQFEEYRQIITVIDAIIEVYETNDMAGTLHTNEEIKEKYGSVEEFTALFEKARKERVQIEEMLNPTLDSISPFPAIVAFSGEELFKKGSHVLLNPFTVEKGLISNDGMHYIKHNTTYREFFTLMTEIGFTYDSESCYFKDMFAELEVVEVAPTEEEMKAINTRHELAELIRSEDDHGMRNYLIDNNIDQKVLFADNSLVSYCIEMNKPICFLEALVTSDDLLLNPKGKLDSAISRAMFSVIFRGLDFNRFLSKLLKMIEFKNVTQEIVDEFVKVSFHEHRQETSLDVFNLYKDKIDEKMLCLALVRDNNVYRMEIPEMKEYIVLAFEKYSDDILDTVGIVSHLNYYKETQNMIALLHKTPTIVIKDKNVLEYLAVIMSDLTKEMTELKPEDDGVSMYNGELLYKSEYLAKEIDKISDEIEFFSQYVEMPNQDDGMVTLIA